MTPAEDFLSDLEQIALPASLAGRLFGVNRATMYRWVAGESRIPEAARRILKAEVAACRAHSYLSADGSRYWQGFRNGYPRGPEVATRAEALRHAVELAP